MAVLVNIVNGNTSDQNDINQVITAFLNEHLNTALNEHAETINLGQNLTNTRRAVRANVLAGVRELAWDTVTSRWVAKQDGGPDRRIVVESDEDLQLIPNFGTRKITSAGTPTLMDDYDGTDRHNFISLDNTVDAADQTALIRYTFRLPTSFSTFGSILFFNKVAATPGTTSVQMKIYDTAGALATLTAGGTAQQNTVWTDTLVTVDMGVGLWLPGTLVTFEWTLTAALGKQAYLGEVKIPMR